MKNASTFKKHGYVWITLLFFLFSFIGHWTTAWFAFVDEQKDHNQPVEVQKYLVEVSRQTFENWQSEFLQLIWQVSGLSFLYYVGSSQSKEGDDRKEEKLDEILKHLKGKDAAKLLKRLEEKYPQS